MARSFRSATLAALWSLLVAAPLFAEGQPQPAKTPKLSFTWKQINAVKQEGKKLVDAGKHQQALGVHQDFLRKHPDLPRTPGVEGPDPETWVKIHHANQCLRGGSDKPGKGISMKSHVIQRYQGHCKIQ